MLGWRSVLSLLLIGSCAACQSARPLGQAALSHLLSDPGFQRWVHDGDGTLREVALQEHALGDEYGPRTTVEVDGQLFVVPSQDYGVHAAGQTQHVAAVSDGYTIALWLGSDTKRWLHPVEDLGFCDERAALRRELATALHEASEFSLRTNDQWRSMSRGEKILAFEQSNENQLTAHSERGLTAIDGLLLIEKYCYQKAHELPRPRDLPAITFRWANRSVFVRPTRYGRPPGESAYYFVILDEHSRLWGGGSLSLRGACGKHDEPWRFIQTFLGIGEAPPARVAP